jgi:hypothetical protein
VHLVGFYSFLSLMMHGAMNVKFTVKVLVFSLCKSIIHQLLSPKYVGFKAVQSTGYVDNSWVISGFRREVDENCVHLCYYAASSGNFLPTFRDNLSVPTSWSCHWRWNRYVVPKRREGITNTRCIITKNGAVLILTIYQKIFEKHKFHPNRLFNKEWNCITTLPSKLPKANAKQFKINIRITNCVLTCESLLPIIARNISWEVK